MPGEVAPKGHVVVPFLFRPHYGFLLERVTRGENSQTGAVTAVTPSPPVATASWLELLEDARTFT